LLVLLLAFTGQLGRSAPVDLDRPGGTFGAATLEGHLETWRLLTWLRFADGSHFPLYVRYSTNPDADGMHILGEGGTIPLFDVSAYPVNEMTMKVHMFTGQIMYLKRSTTDKTRFDSKDGAWVGKMLSRTAFRLQRADGWSIEFNNGLAASVKTDLGGALTWKRTTDGRVLSFGDATQRVGAYYLEKKLRSLTLGGNNLTFDIQANRIHKINYPDSSTDTFTFVLGKTTRYQLIDRWGATNNYEFAGSNGHLTLDSDGCRYSKSGANAITRNLPDGSSESYSWNSKTGEGVHKQPDGTKIKTQYLLGRGPNYMKVHKIEKDTGSGYKTFLRKGYSDKGVLIREIDENKQVTMFKYGKNGLDVSGIQEAGEAWKKEFHPNGQMKRYTANGFRYDYKYPVNSDAIYVQKRSLDGKLISEYKVINDTVIAL